MNTNDIYVNYTSHSGFVVFAGRYQMAQCDTQAQAAHAQQSIVIKHGSAWLIIENRTAGFYELIKDGGLYSTHSDHAVLAGIIERGRK
jgi:hypothetical protein